MYHIGNTDSRMSSSSRPAICWRLCLRFLWPAPFVFSGKARSLIPEWAWYLIPAWWVGASVSPNCCLAGALGLWRSYRRTTLLLIVVFAGAAVVLFISKMSESVSRITLTLSFLVSVVSVPFMRWLVKRTLISFQPVGTAHGYLRWRRFCRTGCWLPAGRKRPGIQSDWHF